MAAAVLNVLNSMLESFVITSPHVTDPCPAGEPARVELLPRASDLAFSPIVDVPVDLAGISKNVNFTSTDILNITIIPPALDAPVPGSLGRLSGQLPIPFNAQVRVEVKWTLQRHGALPVPPASGTGAGSPHPGPGGAAIDITTALIDLDFDVMDVATAALPEWGSTLLDPDIATAAFTFIDLVPGQDFIALEGLQLPSASFLFPPPARRAREGEELQPIIRYVNADVRLSTLGVSTEWLRLRLPIKLAPIGLPIVLACFQHGTYTGASIVFIPKDSPKELDKLQDVLDRLAEIGRMVDSLASLSGAFPILKLPHEIRRLTRALNHSAHRHLRRDDANNNLDGIHFIKKEFEFAGVSSDEAVRDTRADDIFSSIILIGPRRAKATFKATTPIAELDKKLIMETGSELFVTIPNLHSPANSSPAGRVTFDPPVPEGTNPPSWNDVIDAYRLEGG